MVRGPRRGRGATAHAVAAAVAVGLPSPSAAAPLPPPFHFAVSLYGGHWLSVARHVAPFLQPGDYFVVRLGRLLAQPAKAKAVLQALQTLAPQVHLILLVNGEGQMLEALPFLPPFVHWVADDYEPGYDPAFSWNEQDTAREIRLLSSLAAESGVRLVMVPTAQTLWDPHLVPWNWLKLAQLSPWWMVQTQSQARHRDQFLLVTGALANLFQGVRFWPEITVGPHPGPGIGNAVPPAVAAHDLRQAASLFHVRGALVWHAAGDWRSVVALIQDVRGGATPRPPGRVPVPGGLPTRPSTG